MAQQKYLDMTIGFDMCLGHLVEECGEVINVAGKTIRWGTHSRNPDVAGSKPNWQLLLDEMSDLKTAIARMEQVIMSEFVP